MNISLLILTTVVMLLLSFIAFLAIFRMKRKNKKNAFTSSVKNMGAEELLEMILSVPLNEILSVGDKIEIVIRTNGHPIVSREYAVTDWHTELVKLAPLKLIKG